MWATARKGEIMRYTEYHAGKAVIKDRQLLPGAMEKLAAYENTGLTPGQIMELKERDLAKMPMYEGDGYADGKMVYDIWICPNCGTKYEVDYDDYDFCPNCGQRILRQEN